MHSVFRIEQIRQIDGDNRLWQVDMILANDDDPQFQELTKYIRNETFPEEKGWFQLANLLIKIGQDDKAEDVCKFLLDQNPDEHLKAGINNVLGYIKDNQGMYAAAVEFNLKAIEIHQKILITTDPDLTASYVNRAQVYEKLDKYTEALSYYEKARAILETLPLDNPELASCYTGIGLVYEKMNEYSEALSFHEKALQIFETTVPEHHPDLGRCYNNIGKVYNSIGDYSKARSSLEKAAGIKERSLPPTHPSLAISYNHLGKVHFNIGEHLKALSFHEKALEIYQKTISSNQLDPAISYHNIGLVYDKMGDYSKALSFHEKVVDIGSLILPEGSSRLQQWKEDLEHLKKKI